MKSTFLSEEFNQLGSLDPSGVCPIKGSYSPIQVPQDGGTIFGTRHGHTVWLRHTNSRDGIVVSKKVLFCTNDIQR